MLETLFLWVAVVLDIGIVLNNCTMTHVHFHFDLGSATVLLLLVV